MTEKADLTADLVRAASLIPSSVAHAGMRIFSRLSLRQRLTTTSHGSICYVCERVAPAYCAGAKVVGMHTVTPLLDGGGLTITLTGHGEAMHLSVCVCPDNVPAVADIATGIVDSLDVLVAAAREISSRARSLGGYRDGQQAAKARRASDRLARQSCSRPSTVDTSSGTAAAIMMLVRMFWLGPSRDDQKDEFVRLCPTISTVLPGCR